MTGDLSQTGFADPRLLVSNTASVKEESEQTRERFMFFLEDSNLFREVFMVISFGREYCSMQAATISIS
jgi:hypothetical protein